MAADAGWDPVPLPPAELGFICAEPGFILDEKLMRLFGGGSWANGMAAVWDRAAGQVWPLARLAAPRPTPASSSRVTDGASLPPELHRCAPKLATELKCIFPEWGQDPWLGIVCA